MDGNGTFFHFQCYLVQFSMSVTRIVLFTMTIEGRSEYFFSF